MRRSTRPIIAGVMILSLLMAAATRNWAESRRADIGSTQGVRVANASLGSMPSFALGLLLGGMRGPLVMVLWSQSENQKTEKDLEGLDTMIEWIRLLQPEFDTVHIFQIWNKAYNISVQMASKANKYDVILGALDYAHSVDRAKPDDINIVAAFGQLYFDKFGTSSEKEYYRKRVREETLPHAVVSQARHDPGWRRMQLDPLLDSSFNILRSDPVTGEQYLTPLPRRARPSDLPALQEWNDGSPLQYLPQFQPYPDGISTFGMAYNYYKRAEVLQNVEKQRHDQWSDVVIDSRPALSLKNWGEEELEQGHRREVQVFDLANPEDPDELVRASMDISLHQKVKDLKALQLAIVDFDHARKVLPACLEEYKRHISLYAETELQADVAGQKQMGQVEQNCQSYIHEVRAEVQLAMGDYEFLTAMVCPPDQRDSHLIAAMKAYRELQRQSNINLLKYYIDPTLVRQSLPPGFSNERTGEHKIIEDLSFDQAQAAVFKCDHAPPNPKRHMSELDRIEFDRFNIRASIREKAIQATDSQ